MATEKDFRVKNGIVVGDGITFDSATEAGAGVLTWNNLEDTLDITVNNDVTLQVGQETIFYGKATEAISNGDVVMFGGAQGDHILFSKCDFTATGFITDWIIGIATQDFATNGWGFVTTFGKVRGLDTTAYSEGDILFASNTVPGGLTTTEPDTPVRVAAVLRSHQNEGTFFVRVGGSGGSGASAFTDLTDSPVDYTNQAGRVVKVNATEDGVDFGDIVIGSSQREYFTGDGTTTDFTLANSYSSTNGFIVFVNGVIQKEGSGEDYQYINGTTLSFNAAPVNTSEIFVYGITPIAQNVPVDGSVTAAKLAVSAYTRDTFSGDGSTTAFTLTRDPGSVYSPLVFVDGVIQDPITHYTVSGTTLTFTFTPATGTDNILVVYGPTLTAGTVSDGSITFAKLAPGNFSHQVETGDGTTTDFALDQNTVTESHIIVTVASVPQSPDGTTYTITNNGNTISFAAAPANGAKIIIRYYASATYSAPANNTVSTATIQDGAVTPVKLDREYATKGTSIALSIALG